MKTYHRSKLDHNIKIIERIGNSIQSVSIIISIYIVYCGQYLGLITLTSSILIDFVIPIRKSYHINVAIKAFLMIQVFMVYYFLIDSHHISSLSTINELRGSITSTSSSSSSSILSASDNKRTLSHDLIHRISTTVKSQLQQESDIINTNHNNSPIDNDNIINNNNFIIRINNNNNNNNNNPTHDVYTNMDNATLNVFLRVFNLRKNLPPVVNFPDLQYHPPDDIKHKLKGLFDDLPYIHNNNDQNNQDNKSDKNDNDNINNNNNNNNHNNNHFLSNFKNPCWYKIDENDGSRNLICLPYAYILGQPKCGTSDLFERLKLHPDVSMPTRKEVRYFTRGEFTRDPLAPEPPVGFQHHPFRSEYKLSEHSRLTGFTDAFAAATHAIQQRPESVITIDGGPHTFWWPTQSPDGTLLPEDIPPLQIIHLLQPKAPFLLTFTDPVRRTYSDYYFLNDDMKVNRPLQGLESLNHHHRHQLQQQQQQRHRVVLNKKDETDTKTEMELLLQKHSRLYHNNNSTNSNTNDSNDNDNDNDRNPYEKSKEQFHRRMVIQIQSFKECIVTISNQILLSSTTGDAAAVPTAAVTLDESASEEANTDGIWFRASQICAHDRWTYGRAGWGRLSIGLYALYLEKWLEYFPLSQFLINRLEDYDSDPREYLRRIYEFLHLREPSDDEWDRIINRQHANVNHIDKEDMMKETESLLRDFYQPYNDILAVMLQDKRYQWLDMVQPQQQQQTEEGGVEGSSVKNERGNKDLHNKKNDVDMNAIDTAAAAAADVAAAAVADNQDNPMNKRNNNQHANKHNNNNNRRDHLDHPQSVPLLDDDEQLQLQLQQQELNQGIPQELHIIQPRTVYHPPPPLLRVPDDATDTTTEDSNRSNNHDNNNANNNDNHKKEKNKNRFEQQQMELQKLSTTLQRKQQQQKRQHQQVDPIDHHKYFHENSRHHESGSGDTGGSGGSGVSAEGGLLSHFGLSGVSLHDALTHSKVYAKRSSHIPLDSSSSSSSSSMFIPQSFSIDDLPTSGSTVEITKWLSRYINIARSPISLQEGSKQLAMAVFALDIPAVQFLLYDIGVSVNSIYIDDYNRTPLIILSMVGTLAEGHGRSHVFNLLKGHTTWLTPYFNPPLPTQQHSVHAIDIVEGLEEAVYNVSSWLFRAGADVTILDSAGLSALHYAAFYGMRRLTHDILHYCHQQQDGADASSSSSSSSLLLSLLNIQPESTGRTPLHWAVAQGHVEVARLLVQFGADLYVEDNWGVTCYDMLANPGATSAADALTYFNITQRPVRMINRVIHPEWINTTSASSSGSSSTGGDSGSSSSSGDSSNSNGTSGSSSSNSDGGNKGSSDGLIDPMNPMEIIYRGWSGNGGWGDTRLAGYENDMTCEVDQYWANEISGTDIFKKYIARNTPVLIRGLIHEWGAIAAYTKNMLNQTFGEVNVQVSNIPYYTKFGGEDGGMKEMKLSEYIQEVENHKLLGGHHPWYVFRGHPIPTVSDPMDNPKPVMMNLNSLNNSDVDIINTKMSTADSRTSRTKSTSTSFVPLALVQTPAHMQTAFEMVNDEKDSTMRGKEGVDARKVFVNAQWAFGGEGTGAPVHYHNTAWNAVVYGAKKWFLYPPHHQIMSNRQILHYIETDVQEFQSRTDVRTNFSHKSCIQTAGDVMIVPESWGHGVLNLQESVAVATEARAAHWRIKPNTGLLSYLPDDNRVRSRKQQRMVEAAAAAASGGSAGATGASAGVTGGSAGVTGVSAGATGVSAGVTGGSAGVTGVRAGVTGVTAGVTGGSAGATGGSAGVTGGGRQVATTLS